MKIKVQTESGSVYTIDYKALTARRVGAVPIPGVSADEFELLRADPLTDITIGSPMWLDTVCDGLVVTTRVVRAELVD